MSEYTDLIREARELPRADPGDVIDSLVERLADAFEASVAGTAELREYAQKVLDGAGSGDFGAGKDQVAGQILDILDSAVMS